ncbi:MAG: DUF2344 domain-containing protein [Ruminococcus sp.]
MVRMRFMKTGRAKYISHLDLIRCLQRAVCRANFRRRTPRIPSAADFLATTLPLGFTGTGS